jgi:multiple sugar transport system permease protein
MIGYGFAKFKFKGNKILFAFVILTMIVPHRTVQFSMFMQFSYFDVGNLVKIFTGKGLIEMITGSSVKLINTFWPLILLSVTGLGFKNGLFIFMMRQYFRGVPDELEESAYLDGYGVIKTFIKIILPLSIPMMITVFLFAFSWQWTDDFYTTLFFTTNKTILMPDIVKIPTTLETNYAGQNLYYSAIRNTCGLLIIMPLVIMYVFLQNFLVQGIERSGLTAD